jgi:hypothetical protein
MMARARWDALLDRLRGLPARDLRALVIGATLLAPMLLWAGVVRPYRSALADFQDRLAAERSLLEREKAILGEAPRLPGRLEEARVALERWEEGLVHSPNPALAEAEVSALLESIARDSRVLLQEARAMALPPDAPQPEGLTPFRLSVRGESDFEGVLAFLDGMEREPLLLRIVGLSVEPVARGGGGGRGGGAAVQPGTMTFVVIVEAFVPDDAAGAGA